MLKVKGRQAKGIGSLRASCSAVTQGSRELAGAGGAMSAAISPLSWGLWSTGHPSTQQGLELPGLHYIFLVTKREVALHPRAPPKAGQGLHLLWVQHQDLGSGGGPDEQTEARAAGGRQRGHHQGGLGWGWGLGNRTDRSDDTQVQPRFEAGSGRLGWNRDWVLGAVNLGGIWWKPEVRWGTKEVQDNGVRREFGA